jgi:hypothetical protein
MTVSDSLDLCFDHFPWRRCPMWILVPNECDSLLHISQNSAGRLCVEHPSVTQVTWLRSTSVGNPGQIKSSMLPQDVLDAKRKNWRPLPICIGGYSSRRQLWGAVKRVTDFGAYVGGGSDCRWVVALYGLSGVGWDHGAVEISWHGARSGPGVGVRRDRDQKLIEIDPSTGHICPGRGGNFKLIIRWNQSLFSWQSTPSTSSLVIMQ